MPKNSVPNTPLPSSPLPSTPLPDTALPGSVLIANRGEIACRIIDTLRRLSITAIAVYTDPDVDAEHVRLADHAVGLGPSNRYLDIDAIIAAALATGAEAVHPGYGFLAERPDFAARLEAAGIGFIGPSASAISIMGDKESARAAVATMGVPVVPGLSRPGVPLTDAELIAGAAAVGVPLLIKPTAGGGGKGMHRVDDLAELPAALAAARREAGAAFGDDTLFLERFITAPRHIEVQILADRHGNVVAVGDRECSLQRRHQKVIEEASAPRLDPAVRAAMADAACAAARSVDYVGAGTIEFIMSGDTVGADQEFFFMEMNTRLQVEHPVTELVTGIDLVEQQLRIFAGEALALPNPVPPRGHAVEARVYAEDPANGFLPTGGTVTGLGWPSGVRIDTGIAEGSVIGSDYDPMLAKIIAHAPTRAAALTALAEALRETALGGLVTNLDFCARVLEDPSVRAANIDTEFLDRYHYRPATPVPAAAVAAALARADRATNTRLGRGADPTEPWNWLSGFRIGENQPIRIELVHGESVVRVELPTAADHPVTIRTTASEIIMALRREPLGGTDLRADGFGFVLGGIRYRARILDEHAQWIHLGGPDAAGMYYFPLPRPRVRGRGAALRSDGAPVSPMAGTIISTAQNGTVLDPGDTIAIVEAMKMEHPIRASGAGAVRLLVAVGQRVEAGAPIAEFEPAPAGSSSSDPQPKVPS